MIWGFFVIYFEQNFELSYVCKWNGIDINWVCKHGLNTKKIV